jgi:hypothetical protein
MQIWLPRLSNVCGIQGGRNIFDFKKAHGIPFYDSRLQTKASTLTNMPQCYLNYKLLIPHYHIRLNKFTPGSGMLNTDPDPPDPGKL